MGNLYYPQLASGAIAQYPIRKTRVARTVKNVMPDGSMLLYSDPYAARLVWELSYVELSRADLEQLQAHFSNCGGPLRGFTFIDPTDNMLAFSCDMTTPVWLHDSGLAVASGVSDPNGGTAAFALSNRGQTVQHIGQSFAVPSSYQYCFSVYVRSEQSAAFTITRSGSSASESNSFVASASWRRIACGGRLNDSGATLSIGIGLEAGAQLLVYGPQLEPQLAPSRYRQTTGPGAVYANAHWAVDRLPVVADGPDLFATTFTIESTL